LPPAVENDILRVGQEAVTNAIKHAKAHQISVALEFESAVVQMTISDDGRGFNPGDPSFVLSGHFGLAGMSERAAKLGGRLTVDSAPGSGTRIRLVVPIAESLQRDA